MAFDRYHTGQAKMRRLRVSVKGKKVMLTDFVSLPGLAVVYTYPVV